MTRKISTFAFVLGITTALMGASSAGAADNKLYAGSECVRFSGGGVSYWWSTIEGASNTTTYVDCPIVRDHFDVDEFGLDFPSTYVKGMLNKAYVSYTRNNRTVNCSLVAVRRTGNHSVSGWSIGPYDRIDMDGWVGELRFDASNRYISSYDHAYLSCSIPQASTYGRAAINSYRVRERTD